MIRASPKDPVNAMWLLHIDGYVDTGVTADHSFDVWFGVVLVVEFDSTIVEDAVFAADGRDRTPCATIMTSSGKAYF